MRLRVLLYLALLCFSVLPQAWAQEQNLRPGWLTTRLVPYLVTAEGYSRCSAVAVVGIGIVSAEHCISRTVAAVHDRERTALVGGADCSSYDIDFALWRVTVPNGIVPVTIRPQRPRVGEMVWVAGYPQGQFIVRYLPVVGIEHNVEIANTTPVRILPEMIEVQHPDIARTGISGGAMFSAQGELLGIISAIIPGVALAGAVPISYGVERCKLY